MASPDLMTTIDAFVLDSEAENVSFFKQNFSAEL